MSAPPNNDTRNRWKRALAAKQNRAATPGIKQIPKAGLGPNKASGHKGGISRQGSKRG